MTQQKLKVTSHEPRNSVKGACEIYVNIEQLGTVALHDHHDESFHLASTHLHNFLPSRALAKDKQQQR